MIDIVSEGKYRYINRPNVVTKSVAESLHELKDLNSNGVVVKYYLGSLCVHGHKVKTSEGKILDKSVRYYLRSECCECKKIRTKRHLFKGESRQPVTSKFSEEDYKLAEELGMTLEEFKNMI